MTPYEKLVEEAGLAIATDFRAVHSLRPAATLEEFSDPEHFRRQARAVLAVVAAELRTVTPEMVRVGVDHRLGTLIDGAGNNWKTDTSTLFRQMLSVSPLNKRGE